MPIITLVRQDKMTPKPERVIFNSPATIVLWSDGKKTVVKCHNEAFDTEKGLAMAIVKRFLPRADFNRLLNDELDRRYKKTVKNVVKRLRKEKEEE